MCDLLNHKQAQWKSETAQTSCLQLAKTPRCIKQSPLKIHTYFILTCCLKYPSSRKMLSYFSSICSGGVHGPVPYGLLWQHKCVLTHGRDSLHWHCAWNTVHRITSVLGICSCIQEQSKRLQDQRIKQKTPRYLSSLLASHIPFFSLQSWLKVLSVKMDPRTDLLKKGKKKKKTTSAQTTEEQITPKYFTIKKNPSILTKTQPALCIWGSKRNMKNHYQHLTLDHFWGKDSW